MSLRKTNEIYLGSALAPGEQDSTQASNYLGNWDASTNTPTLVNGTGVAGQFYICTVAGTCDFGAGSITFEENDWVVYTGTAWVINTAEGSLINDDTIDTQLTWSSHKINGQINGLLDDNFTDTKTTWSSAKIQQAINTGTPEDVYIYKGEIEELPESAVLGNVYKCNNVLYWWNGTEFEPFESIRGISVNGTAQTITNGNVDITVPTKTSDLTNDSGFIDKTVNDLDNYYTESETDTLLSAKQPKTLEAPITVDGTIETTVEGTLAGLNSAKANNSSLATVATSGDYTDLTNTPTLGTASEKDSTTYVNPGNNNIPTSNAVYQAMTSMLEGAFHPAGNKTCAELTSDLLVQANVGHIYKITDNGTTDANWVGGAGQTITANQLAVVVYGNTAGTFLFNLENGINVDMSTYQTKAITPITVDGTVKSNVEDALDAINTLAGSNKTGLGNKADKVSGATNGNFAGLDANGNLTDSGINADSLNDLQLTYNGSTYSTTSALIIKLTSDIVARKLSSGTVGGNIAITWTGKSCITGSYSIHDSGAGFVVLDFENDQDGKNHCTYSISNGSAVYITWSKFATKSNFYNLSSYGGYATGTKIWWKIPNLFVVGPDFTYRTNVFLLSSRESGCSALLTIGDNGSNTRKAKIIMLNGTLDGVTDFYFDSSTCSLYYSIQWSRLQIVQLSGQKIDIADAIQSSSSEATQYTAITPTITATKSDISDYVRNNIFYVGDRRDIIGWADLSNSVDIDGSSNYANNVGRIEGHNAIIEVSNPNTGYQWPVTNSGDSNKFMDFGGAIQFFVDKVNNHLYVRFADSVDMSAWGQIATESNLAPLVPYNQTDGNYLMVYAAQHWNTYSNKALCKAYTSSGELVFAGILQWNGNSGGSNIHDRIATKQAGSGSITSTNDQGSVSFSENVTYIEMHRIGSHD